jgi:hypothetical protein
VSAAEGLPPWAEHKHGETRPTPRRPARIVIPCAGRELARVALAGMRAQASNNPALAALLAAAVIED